MTAFTIGATTLVGQVRSANEDSFLATDDLAAVADGMGGHRAGEVASADTVDVLRTAAGSRSVEELVAAVHRANRGINERAAESEELRGMGTTVCVVGLVRYDDEEQVAVLNVGDSRVYLLADGVLTQLTEDHSLVETLLREGRISAEEAEHHPQRNVITRALGVEALVVVDAWLLSPADGDRLLLCSDGLFGELSEERITEVLLEAEDPEVVARRLAAEADAAGGRDNITTIVVDISDTGIEPAPVDGRYRRISTPAVDLSDPDDDSDRTDTVLAVVIPPVPEDEDEDADADDVDDDRPDGPVPTSDDESSIDADDLDADDLATVDDAGAPLQPPGSAASPIAAGAEPAADPSDPDPTNGGFRWRTAAFLVAVVAVLAVMAGVLIVASRSGWVVAVDDGTIVVLRGPKDGVLFLGPAEVARFAEVDVGDLTEADRRQVERGRSFGSEAEAFDYVDRLGERTTTTTSTTTTTTTTTTTAPLPVDPNAVAPPPAGP